MKDFESEKVDLPVEDVEITDDVISFGKHGKIKDKEYVAEAEEVAPVVDAVVVEEVPVEEAIAAPIAVEAEPEPVYNAPIEEPVHHVRWPWALLALPLLAIPFIPRHVTEVVETVPVAVVTTPAVRAVTTIPAPTCDGHWTVMSATPLLATASDVGATVKTLDASTQVTVDQSAGGYYHVVAGNADGYLPVHSVTCVKTLGTPKATTTVTG